MDKIIPKMKDKDSINPYINKKIKGLQKQNNKIFSKIHKLNKKWPTINTHLMEKLKDELKNIRTKLKIEFSSSINTYWKEKVENIPTNNSTNIFPQLNCIFRKKGIAEIDTLKIPINSHIFNSAEIDPTQLKKDNDNNVFINTPVEKLNVIGAHFASINNKKTANNRPQLNKLINSEVNAFKDKILLERANNITLCTFNGDNVADNPSIEGDFNNYFINYHDLNIKFKQLNNKKSFGLNKIPNIVFKKIPPNLIFNYVILFNNLLNYSLFPETWKVVAILKKDKNKNMPTSYRPISLLPNISKVFETIINDKTVHFFNINDIIPESQFGFRHNHSTVHAINKVTSDINWALNSKKCLGACIIDLEKAFDTIWSDGLLYKLIKKST